MNNDNDNRTRQIAYHWTLAQPVVGAFIVSAVVNFHDADDILGQVAETIVAKYDTYDRSRPFTPWALGIARHRILQYLERREHERHRYFDLETLRTIATAFDSISDEIPLRLSALRECLEQVQGKSRKVMDLRYVDELPAESIADRMNMSSNAVWVMLHRIRQTLASCIERKVAPQGGVQ